MRNLRVQRGVIAARAIAPFMFNKCDGPLYTRMVNRGEVDRLR